MQDLRTILGDDHIAALRAGYDPAAMSHAASSPFSIVYPPLDTWVNAMAGTFFDRSVLAPRDRERCIIALLTINGAPVSLAIHVYWGLMEGLSVDDICQTIGLVGVYAGVPRVAFGMSVTQRLLGQLVASAKSGTTDSAALVTAFIAEFR